MDKVKQIKIKKMDNTYTDYLPIGVDATNVDMAEGDTLQERLSKGSYNFKTIKEMLNCVSLAAGMVANTMGGISAEDGASASYLISKTAGEYKLNNGLYAQLLNDKDNNYYDEITYSKYRYNDKTDYYITMIPLKDNNNNQIDFYVGDGENILSPLEYAQTNYTTLTTNGYYLEGSSREMAVISNGKIIQTQYSGYTSIPEYYRYLAIKKDRSITSYQACITTAQDMINDGVQNAFLVKYQIIENGNILDTSAIGTGGDANLSITPNPRQCIGIKNDKTVIILTCDGRTDLNVGLTSEETAEILTALGCTSAWNMDGGGSTSTIIKGSKLNRNIDDNGTTDRCIRYTLNVKRNTVNKGIADIYSKIGEEKQNIVQQIIPYIISISQSGLTRETDNLDGKDLNTLISEIHIGYGNSCINKPTTENGYFINIPHNKEDYKNLYNTQIWITRDYNKIYIRQQVNGVFKNWQRFGHKNITRFNADSDVPTILAETHVYQTINFVNQVANNDIITFDTSKAVSGTYPYFKIGSIGGLNTTSAIVTIQIEFTSVAEGNKFIRLCRGTGDTVVQNVGDFKTVGRTMMMLTTFVNDIQADEVFRVELYGDAGDQTIKSNIIVQLAD